MKTSSKSTTIAFVIGLLGGVLFALPTLFIAVESGGGGHGCYIEARAFFPISMLLTLLEGRISTFSIALAVLQFPAYGALLGWSIARRNYLPFVAVASVHAIAAICCFAGPLDSFIPERCILHIRG
jgi:hypothetical protein